MTAISQELSNALAAAVEKSAQSVVRVEGRRRGPASGTVWSADGVIVTTHHALEWDEEIEIVLPDAARVPASLVGRDPTTDLAVLKVSSGGLAVPAWAAPETARVGHLVLAVARPGRSVRASLGIVSVLGAEEWRTPAGGKLERYLAADLTLYRGFSGGLMIDPSGGALGVATSGLLRGVSLAVPAPTVKRVVEALLAHGQVRRGFLGVSTMPVQLPPKLGKRLGQETALLVTSVQEGSPAAQAGIVLGDVLHALDGKPLGHYGDLLAALDEERIGKEASVQLVRAGGLEQVKLTIGARGDAP